MFGIEFFARITNNFGKSIIKIYAKELKKINRFFQNYLRILLIKL